MRVRPTADRVKEALFSILASRVDLHGSRVLDLFAGTGNLGIEALSRGAELAVFVDSHRESADVIRQNLETCGFAGRSEVIVREAGATVKLLESRDEKFDLIFLDPPYLKGLATETVAQLAEATVVAPGGLIIAEHAPDETIAEVGDLRIVVDRRYGDTVMTIMTKDPV
jgi:16S rRNA (guanine966-N2)-methyltransferase